jgi:hypothetical protein
VVRDPDPLAIQIELEKPRPVARAVVKLRRWPRIHAKLTGDAMRLEKPCFMNMAATVQMRPRQFT